MIYIEIKFSHRHDSPGCIEINNINVTITNNTANFIGYCILGDIMKIQLMDFMV